ncbi:MAG: hypothetical protein ACM3ZU_06635 [Bacteroidota bacterium]
MSRLSKRWGVLGRGALAFPSPRSRGAGAFRAREHAGQGACGAGEHAGRMSIFVPLRRPLTTEETNRVETNRVADILKRPLEEARWG